MLDKSPIIRAFFGIPIPEDKAQEFRKRLLKKHPHLKDQVRWTRSGNHHITLRFLGNVAEQKIPKLIELIDEAVKNITSFRVTLWNITPFPAQHGRMAVVNIGPCIELQNLYNAIDLAISVDFPSENRPYMPHITLFRVKNNNNVEFEKISLDDQTLDIETLILYQSIPIEKGSLYVPLHKFFFVTNQ